MKNIWLAAARIQCCLFFLHLKYFPEYLKKPPIFECNKFIENQFKKAFSLFLQLKKIEVNGPDCNDSLFDASNNCDQGDCTEKCDLVIEVNSTLQNRGAKSFSSVSRSSRILNEEIDISNCGCAIADFPFFIDFLDSKKVDPKKETECFDLNKPGIITIYVEQSIERSREISSRIGHTFIGLKQGDIVRNLGFYPDSPNATLFTPQTAEIHDNSKSPYHVSISKEVSAKEFKKAIKAINNFQNSYDLRNYNCSDFGIEVAGKSGLTLPKTVGKYKKGLITFFEGRNPSDLGEDIRKMSTGNGITINKNKGLAPERKGDCN